MNPAFELKQIFEHWRTQDSGDVPMQTQRGIAKESGLETMRRVFHLVGQLEVEVEKLQFAGVAPKSSGETLNFCTRCAVGYPGGWQSRPSTSQQFPGYQLDLLESLGTIIGMYNGGAINLGPQQISHLLDDIEQALLDAPLPELLDHYIRRLISEVRRALENSEAFSSSTIAEQLFQLGVATMAGEAATTGPEKKTCWSTLWHIFFPSAVSSVTGEASKAVFRMLPM
ncbi:hypothetical protein [Brevibacterium aurantiacum]|uniref:hypothetical protein n=1 Tax=Brevibacterium aurantiacum TaxID=273384 RepID=UPI0001BC2B59|nr:hypothetical protein [Brevibacterium aurantiacum]